MNTHTIVPDKGLNVRATPGGIVLGALPKGTTVRQLETKNGWSRITSSTLSGWVATEFLAPTEAPKAPIPAPKLGPLTLAQRQELFGRIEFVPNPTSADREGVRITNGWAAANIVEAKVPQLVTAGVSQTGRVWVHKRAKPQLLEVFASWEEAGLLDCLRSWGGCYNARFIRGSTTTLSTHAHGSSFDINMQWNGLNKEPAAAGTHGSVRELVPIAEKLGWYWGGRFTRRDGMHFEIARLRTSS
jgi:hypothetical protein